MPTIFSFISRVCWLSLAFCIGMLSWAEGNYENWVSGDKIVGHESHTEEKPCEYTQCDKALPSHSHLQRHEIIPRGRKRNECNQCGRTFANHSYLRIHKRTHTGEKPCECNECAVNDSTQQDPIWLTPLISRKSHSGQRLSPPEENFSPEETFTS
ncbi:zinc finger protein [Cricetulus griseus]|uniref:Zinc finger protein n=1 Tax=Cricetulus griseus TaxID=10029 RepID=A0A061IKA6_CRIGR|nr:zinc finger protein [Cricetulus griseus]